MDEQKQDKVDELYVLLKRNYRISRNIRLIWFFNNIFRNLAHFNQKKIGLLDNENEDEIQVIAVVQKSHPKENDDSTAAGEDQSEVDMVDKKNDLDECILHPHTKVYYLSRGYRLVFALDLSPSLFRVDAHSYRTAAEASLSRLADCLCSLVQPLHIPGGDSTLTPSIYVTVFVQTRPHKKRKQAQDVIVQGCLLTPRSVLHILQVVECKIYHRVEEEACSNDIGDSQHYVRHDHGIVSMLRTGLLALKVLPSNTAAGIIIITDGVVGMPDMAVLETLLNQLRSTTTTCSFLYVPSSQDIFADFSFSVNMELLEFISTATYGTCFKHELDENYKKEGMNVYQKGLLVWRFQLGQEREKLLSGLNGEGVLDIRKWDPETDLRYTPKQKNMLVAPVLRKKHLERTLRVSLLAVLSVRLREGYMISSVSVKNQNQIEVKLVFPWNHGVTIKYSASAAWPVNRNATKVEVYIEGAYEFLSDATVGIGQETWSRYRSMVIRRFKHFMKGLSQTDHMLTHLLSFTSDPVYYTINYNQKHVPLFYLPPNSNQLVLSTSSGNDPALSDFAMYWKPILSLDVNIWQRWLHTHRIEIILQHDMPLPKHLHLKYKSGRYHSIQTSTALSQLTSLLRDWSTFVLLENHSYVKFIYESEDKPSSFYLVRLSNKAHVVIIRLAFLIGTTGQFRNQISKDLRERILSLTFPTTAKQSSTLNLKGSGLRSRNPSAQMRLRHVSGPERACAVHIHKPLERMLIRYDQVPRDFMQPPNGGYRHGKGTSMTSVKSGTSGGDVGSTSQVQDLCRYLKHCRWVWSVTNHSCTPLPVEVAGQMARLLVKLRLSEGFNFASSSSGVVSLVREFPFVLEAKESSGNNDVQQNEETYYCLAQFIIFPPTDCTSRESLSLEGSGDEEEDTAEADGELFLATEMWIEPQYGFVTLPEPQIKPHTSRSQGSRHPSGKSDSGRSSRLSSVSSCLTPTSNIGEQGPQRFVGLSHLEIPQMVSKEDQALLSITVTIEHLRLMCVPESSVLPELPQRTLTDAHKGSQHKRSMQSEGENGDSTSEEHETVSASTKTRPSLNGIIHIPSLFDFVGLLDRCSRVKLMFMTLSQDASADDVSEDMPNQALFKFFHQSLGKLSDREAILSDMDSTCITAHMIRREKENYSSMNSEQEIEMENLEESRWRCFLKILPKGKVVIILVPATYKDLQTFSDFIPGFAQTKAEPGRGIDAKCIDENVLLAQSKSHSNPASSRSSSHSSEMHSPRVQERTHQNIETNIARDGYRMARRLSVKRYNSQTSNKSGDENWNLDSPSRDFGFHNGLESSSPQLQLSLPVYVYECATQVLVEQMLKDPMANPSQFVASDLEEDHRPSWIRDHFVAPLFSPSKMQCIKPQKSRHAIKSVDSKVEYDASRYRSMATYLRSQSYPFHPIQTPTMTANDAFFPIPTEDVFSPTVYQSRQADPEMTHICEMLVDAYHRCFVKAVSNSLQQSQGHRVASIDVQAATDAVCQESVQEIDITQFLLITCPQVASFKEQHHQPTDMMEMRDQDDVFASSSDLRAQVPLPGVDLTQRHTSSSSTTDPSMPDPSEARRPAEDGTRVEQSPDQRTRGNDDQISNMHQIRGTDEMMQTSNIENETHEESVEFGKTRKNGETKTGGQLEKHPSRSAFKKLRKRPTKSEDVSSKQVSDTDGDTADSDSRPLAHTGHGKSKLISLSGTPDAGSLPRSLKVTKPLQKITPASRQGWDGLPDFPLHALKENHPRHISGSDDQIKVTFRNQLTQYFRPVQSIPDFFYYHPEETIAAGRLSDEERELELAGNEDKSHDPGMVIESDQYVEFDIQDEYPEPESELATDETLTSTRGKKNLDRGSAEGRDGFMLDGEEFFIGDSDGSDIEYMSEGASSDEEAAEGVNDEDFPLFLCMTCTVRDKSTGNHGTMPVNGLPVSLRTVLNCLERPCTHVDLSQLYITLDLIWIMLPPEAGDHSQVTEDDAESENDKYSSGLLPEEDDSPRHEPYNLKERINTIHEERGQVDLLSALPPPCLNAVKCTKDQIEWLLRDEIICALRTCETITSLTLEKVAGHVEETSASGDNCMKETVGLQFVFGADKSYQLFHSEFERQFKDFKGYRLRKEGPYYYLTMERTFLPIQHWPIQEFIAQNAAFEGGDHDLQVQRNEFHSNPEAAEKALVTSDTTGSDTKMQQQGFEADKRSGHAMLRRTKTAPTALKSPPTKMSRSSKSCVSLPLNTCQIHSSLSFRSLPNNEEIMSVDAIESDVCQPTAATRVRPTVSSQSTPVRKTASSFDINHGNVTSSSMQRCSPSLQLSAPQKCSRQSSSRLSLPNTNEIDIGEPKTAGSSTDFDSRTCNKCKPVKQRSMESNLNWPDKAQQRSKRRSIHSVTPLSLRNSPLQHSGQTSPLGTRHMSGHNSSFGSSGSAPLNMCRRVSQGTAPVMEAVGGTRSVPPLESQLNSSTPMLQRQPSAGSGMVSANTVPSSMYLFGASMKDPTSSPVSVSDCDPRRYSTASWMESGYDGEESDLECEDDYMVSLHDCGNDLPSFWLIAMVNEDNVKIFFHRRSSAAVQEEVTREHRRIFDAVIGHVHSACKCVNQTLLLLELHDSRTCNALLVEETEEDIWRRDYNPVQFGQPSEDIGDESNRVLLASMTNAPGQFACDCMLETIIPLHPRLRAPGAVPGKSGVIATVRDLLINLMVSNRKNTFVYKLPDKSVFYCRMTEDSGKPDSRRSSLLFQATSMAAESVGSSTDERRGSKESLPGVGLHDIRSGASSLVLRWHGVGPLIAQQDEELEKMNQSIIRKLNESVLEKITVLLQRKSKLTPADVLFIQQPSTPTYVSTKSPQTCARRVMPSVTLSYSLPDEFESCIPAVRYYLHQNLLQFMAVPRYTDPAQSVGHFAAYRMASTSEEEGVKKTASSTAGDGSVFLFHQSIEPGKTGYGIACVVLEITDLAGRQLVPDILLRLTEPEQLNLPKLLQLIKVDRLDQKSPSFRREMLSSRPDSAPSSDKNAPPKYAATDDPGVSSVPKVVVRFHLWLKGSLTVDHLDERLRPAVQHCLYDCVTELLMIRLPLCDLNSSVKDMDDELAPMEFQKTKSKGIQRFARKMSLPNPGFLSLYSAPQRPLDDDCLTDLSPANNDQGGKQGRRTSSKPDRRKSYSAQAEEGEVGNLKEIYRGLSEVWFDDMAKKGSPAAFRINMGFSTMDCAESALPDLQKTFASTLTDCKVRAFVAPSGSSSMTAFDFGASGAKSKKIPGRYLSYTFIARNFALWRKAVGCFTQQGQQVATAKFPPYDSSMKHEQSPRPQEHRLSVMYATYIPRQQFVLATVRKRAMKVWGYNISNEIVRNLQSRLRRCVDFHNARQRALDCITAQKLGLFRYCTFENGFSSQNADKSVTGSQPNTFLQDVKDVDIVVRNSSLPSDRELQSQQKTKPAKRAFFNEAYITNKPCRPLSAAQYRHEKDVAARYAMQYVEMKGDLKKRGEEQQQLYRVFSNWRERPATISNTSITRDVLQVLLRHSRLIHHVSSPILFSPSFRRMVLDLKTKNGPQKGEILPQKETQMTKKQKRLSGSIRKSGDFSGRSVDENKSRSRSNSTRKEGAKGSKSCLLQSPSQSLDESKYDAEELRRALMMHYVQYWQSMHFILVKCEKNGQANKPSKKSSSIEKSNVRLQKDSKPNVKFTLQEFDGNGATDQPMYLYRIASGGIVIVQISCMGMNFLVKLHILEASRLQHQQSLNQQMAVLFLNECEHLKDYTHVHSFAYDFHLRYIQWYIQDRQTAIRPGYHLVALLQDFIAYYKTQPLYVFNHVNSGTIEAPCSHVSPDELYEYIVGKQAASFGFKPLKLSDNETSRNEHALVSAHLVGQFHSLSCNKEDHNMYDVCYVISHDQSEHRAFDAKSEKTIKLNFFVLFTNRRHLFPRFDLQENISPLQTTPRSRASFPLQRKIPLRLSIEKTPVGQSHILADKSTIAAGSHSTSVLPKLHKHGTLPTTVRTEYSEFPVDDISMISQPEELRPELSTPPAVSGVFKRKMFLQGRRQSMPNVGIVARTTKHNQQMQTSRQAADTLQLRNLAGHKIQAEVDKRNLGVVQDSTLPMFVLCEIQRLRDFVLNICKSAEIQCYRNHLWDKVYMEKSSQPKTLMLTVEDFEHLLKHCQMVPLSKLDERAIELCKVEAMGVRWALGLGRRLMSRHNQICRLFTNVDGTKQYLGILNPKLYTMMLLIIIDTSSEEVGMFAVMRDRIEELDKDQPKLNDGNPNLIPLFGHLHNMIDFMCYHTWVTLLSPN